MRALILGSVAESLGRSKLQNFVHARAVSAQLRTRSKSAMCKPLLFAVLEKHSVYLKQICLNDFNVFFIQRSFLIEQYFYCKVYVLCTTLLVNVGAASSL